MTPRPTEPDIAVMVPASLARIIASGNAGSRDLDALENCVQCAIDSDAITVQMTRADADILPDALAAAAERESSDVDDWSSDGEHDDQAEHHRECVAALDRLADAIAAAVRQEGND